MNVTIDAVALKQALQPYADALSASFPKEDCEGIQPSPRFKHRMEWMLRNHQKFYYFWINTVGKRVASVLICLITLLAITTVSVKALREGLIEFITKTYEKFTSISVHYDGDIPQTVVPIKPSYVPNEYIKKRQRCTEHDFTIEYCNEEGVILHYGQSILSGYNGGVDTEDADFKTVMINGYEGILVKKNGFVSITFSSNEYMFTILGQIGEEEIVKIAESIPLK